MNDIFAGSVDTNRRSWQVILTFSIILPSTALVLNFSIYTVVCHYRFNEQVMKTSFPSFSK